MKKWLAVALLWTVALLNYLDRQIIFSLFPLLRDDLKLSDGELGLTGAAFLWVYAIVSPFAGFAADRLGHKRLIILSLLVWSAVTWATGQATSLNELIAARAAMGIAEAFYLPAALALIAAHHGEGTRALATGLHFSGIYVGVVLGGWGGGWMGTHYGWRLPFTLLGLVGIGYAAVLALLPPPPTRADNTPTESKPFVPAAAALLRTPGFATVTIVFVAFSLAGWMVYAWMPSFLFEKFRMTLADAGLNATLYVQAASVAGILIGGPLGDRISSKRVQGAALAAGAPFLFLAGITAVPALVLLGLAMYGLSRGGYDANNMPVVCRLVPEKQRATAYGFLNAAGTFSGGLITWAAGALKSTFGLGAMLQLAAVLLLIGGLLLWRLRLPGDLDQRHALSR